MIAGRMTRISSIAVTTVRAVRSAVMATGRSGRWGWSCACMALRRRTPRFCFMVPVIEHLFYTGVPPAGPAPDPERPVASTSRTPYAELHAHTNFSFLDGASAPDELVERAVELGLTGLAATDHNGLYGAVRFTTAAHDAGLHPIIGAEIELL